MLFQLGIDDDTMADEEEEDDGKGPPKLFTMNFVNSYGNAHLEQLNNDDDYYGTNNYNNNYNN